MLTGWSSSRSLLHLLILFLFVNIGGVGDPAAAASHNVLSDIIRQNERSPVGSGLLSAEVVTEYAVLETIMMLECQFSEHDYLETLLDQQLRLDIVTFTDNQGVELGEQRVLQLDLGLLLQ